MDIKTITFEVGGKPLKLEIGRLAEQANAAVVATYGETVVLVTAVASKPREDLDYFPLSVEYQEKLYAGGIIKGSRWVKREGRPTDEAILTSRLIDRSLRPMFPEGFKHEVQVIPTVLSVDSENDADIPAIIASATALSLSDIPFEGPVGAVRIGLKRTGDKTELLVNPTYTERSESLLDLVVSGTQDAVIMVEAGANEVSEAEMLEAFAKAHAEVQNICKHVAAFTAEVGKPKLTFEPDVLDKDIVARIKKDAKAEIAAAVQAMSQLEREDYSELAEALFEKYNQEVARTTIKKAIGYIVKELVREQTINKGIRLDGRKPGEIRPISGEVGYLPRTHGSAIFKRGATQALTITTLGSPALEQLIESMEGESTKRYMHHYMMPPYTVGEVGRIGWPSRREIGHGALAERAIEPMIPEEEVFPYTIRVVSEIMSSNGSTSMASVCGSTLSLMDAGVPLKKPVSGIAMGLMTDGKKHVILSDITGQEDFKGDMDFKVAGTKDGITAMQMDVKIKGITQEILQTALEQAHVGRMFILGKILEILPAARANLSQYAPKIKTVTIPVDKIGELIGPGGKVIKKLIADTGAEINVNDDGKVFVSSVDDAAIDKAIKFIEGLARELKVGDEFDGVVTREMNFGVFVEVLPGKEGLVHISQVSPEYSGKLQIGAPVHVRVYEIDSMGRVNLTTFPQGQEPVRERREFGGGNRGGFGGRGGDRGGFRPRRQFDDRRRF